MPMKYPIPKSVKRTQDIARDRCRRKNQRQQVYNRAYDKLVKAGLIEDPDIQLILSEFHPRQLPDNA